MKSYFFLSIALFSSIPLMASFAEIEVYQTPLEQPIFLLGDAHDYKKERDGHYFDTLLKIFDEADNDPTADPDTTEYVVLIENSPSMHFEDNNPGFDLNKYILASLCETAKEKPFRRTKIIDCDPRHISSALLFLFGPGESLFPLFKKNKVRQDRFKAIYKVGYFEVTFQDVADSIDDLKKQVHHYRSHWQDPKVLEIFDTILEGDAHKESLQRVYRKYSIDPNQTIFDYLGTTTKFDLKRKQFKNMVSNIFYQFFDLVALHHLLLERNNPKIKKFIIIAGTAHTGDIGLALNKLKMGYEQVYREWPGSHKPLFFKQEGIRILQMPLPAISKWADRSASWKENAQIIVLFVALAVIVYIIIDK